MIRRRSFAEQHPILLCLGILFGVAFLITYWPVFVALCVAGALVVAGRAAHRRSLERARRRAEIARRAEYEHAAILRGDAWLGTFGQYQPSPVVANLSTRYHSWWCDRRLNERSTSTLAMP
jgi:hypothetical protein